MDSLGLSVDWGRVTLFTTSLNSFFGRLGRRQPRLLKIWFNIGVGIACVLVLCSIGLLLASLIAQFTKPADQQILTPILPGVNLPLSQVVYFFVALITAGIVHEFGHAIAAIGEGVTVHGFGVFVMVLYPGAFVELDERDLEKLLPLQQLRIFCAGVWHNVVLCCVCLLIMILLPTLLWPLYSSSGNNGATIVWVHPQSPIQGSVWVGSMVQRLDDCPVLTTHDWQLCLEQSLIGKSASMRGFCLTKQNLEVFPRHIYNCCGSGSNNNMNGQNEEILSSSICFDPTISSSSSVYLNQSHCLPVRQIISNPGCDDQEDCQKGLCLAPRLTGRDKLMRIKLHDEPTALFVGDPRVIWQSLIVMDLRPRWSIIPVTGPLHLQRQLEFTLSLSAALGVLNAAPAYLLDGQYLVAALAILFLPRTWTDQRRQQCANGILTSGTLLFGVTVVISLIKLVVDKIQ